ncbi:MAG: YqaJ viral recombinase family protein [Waltera sp.]
MVRLPGRKGIGGSDVAAIMGVSPFATKRDLFYDKTGIRPVLQENEDNWVAKEVGHRLEAFGRRDIFLQKTGLKIFPVRTMFRHPLYPWMLADVDFFIEFADGSYGILECKTTNYNCQEKWANNTIPVNYEYQVRHYMSVMNIDKAYIACLYGNNEEEFLIRPIERDLEIEEDLLAEERYFWEEKVLKREEPEYVEKARSCDSKY